MFSVQFLVFSLCLWKGFVELRMRFLQNDKIVDGVCVRKVLSISFLVFSPCLWVLDTFSIPRCSIEIELTCEEIISYLRMTRL